MGGLILIAPIVAFDIWLALTTGRQQWVEWKAQGKARYMLFAVLIGLLLGTWLAFFLKFGSGDKLRAEGFPIPTAFFHLDNNVWTRTVPQEPLPTLGTVTNFLTGLVAPMIPFKIAAFLKLVKAELK